MKIAYSHIGSIPLLTIGVDVFIVHDSGRWHGGGNGGVGDTTARDRHGRRRVVRCARDARHKLIYGRCRGGGGNGIMMRMRVRGCEAWLVLRHGREQHWWGLLRWH
jgi:hypothetical protein